ncbi:GNAT family N-acetyltransferase [Natrialbaceae archaeon AArc-T1-2]|uniref:GNAT family N-acetyltransferase n=1 Tax=Natrialbaceae archaeon AArc-T1-2 TaxID=3053904 RepID=UPI00255A8A99|nr:GNAT family N-acetyltransferase [Natrialbaceae archaeon AArc-T1-2]WIV67912.1 GNAT family N-acetyltransferase [Natrialbaceae archaeon AArc-T1-2]
MEYEILGWPPDGPKLPLDHERFSYAGKFVMTNTGKAVAREGDGIVAAAAFNEDRTDSATLWLRYVTVARDRRGEGIGPELLGLVRDRAKERGYDRLRIAVNNPYAYEALHRVGFTYTGETTGIAELVLEYPADCDLETPAEAESYRAGLAAFRDRDLTDDERAFLEDRLERGPPVPDVRDDGR